jgi:NAD(P)-dependent dehydrogenase (short-subunit alcohol dehydrogenase family)
MIAARSIGPIDTTFQAGCFALRGSLCERAANMHQRHLGFYSAETRKSAVGSIAPSKLSRNYGRIVNTASVAGKVGNPNASAYSAAKAGLIALTKSLGKVLRQDKGRFGPLPKSAAVAGRMIILRCAVMASGLFEELITRESRQRGAGGVPGPGVSNRT